MADKNPKPLRNQQGIGGWVIGGRYGYDFLERYAFTLHRLTGIALLLYLVPHLFVTAQRLQGREPWEGLMSFLNQPVFHVLEFLVFLSFAYHVLNGVRLILTELGFAMGKPKRPVYPHVACVRRQRPLFLGLMGVAFLVSLAGFVDFFFLH